MTASIPEPPETIVVTKWKVACDGGVADAFAFPGFVPAYIRPLFCRGVGPFRWAAPARATAG